MDHARNMSNVDEPDMFPQNPLGTLPSTSGTRSGSLSASCKDSQLLTRLESSTTIPASKINLYASSVAQISRFELLPGEIRNEIYLYLFSPSQNTSYDTSCQNNANTNNTYHQQSPQSDLYAFKNTSPAKVVVSGYDSEDEDIEFVVYPKGDSTAIVPRTRVFHEILLTNKRIYTEAHRLLYRVCGPVILVRGVPYNATICRLMARLGLRWFYTTSRDASDNTRGSVATLDVRWTDGDDDNVHMNDKYSSRKDDPHIVLLGSQCLQFVQFLRVLKIKEANQTDIFDLTFTFWVPQNIYHEPIAPEEAIAGFQTYLLNVFKTFTGMGIRYSLRNHLSPQTKSRYLALLNQPIICIRSEILQIVCLLRSISHRKLKPTKHTSLIDDFCKWVFIGDIVKSRLNASYPQLNESRLHIDDKYPYIILKRIGIISFYNVTKALFLMIVQELLPEELVIPNEIQSLKELCNDLDDLVEQTLNVETNDGAEEIPVLEPSQTVALLHLQAMMCFYLSPEPNMAERATECLNRCVELSEGDRRRNTRFLADMTEYWQDAGSGGVADNLAVWDILVETFPSEDMQIEIPDKMESTRINWEREILTKYGYKGDLLTDVIVQDPKDFDHPPGGEDTLDLVDWDAYRLPTGRKIWLGIGSNSRFVAIPS